MKLASFAAAAVMAIGLCGPALEASAQPAGKPWYKRPFDPARVQPCDRACLIGFMDQYLDALIRHDPSVLPLAEEVWFTENTGRIDLGEGVLWRSKVEPTRFKITVADPVSGQVAVQWVPKVQGAPALVAIRLKVERRMITEVEHMLDRNVAPQAMELLTTPRPALLADVSPKERSSREFMLYAANAYFDALTGDNGAIAPFSEDCVRHEQGYQTVRNAKPGRAMPSPVIPDPSTPFGKEVAELSVMTCAQQIDTRIFTGIKKIWPRRAVIDEQKGLIAIFPLFVHDGTRRPVEGQPWAPQNLPGMITNMVTMETFGVRKDHIFEVEAFPFVTFAYGLGDGWTPGKGR